MMKRVSLIKWVRRGVFGVVCLVTLGALVFVEENYRGKRAWENYKREALERGVQLDFEALIPPPVPDDQNFAATPLLKQWLGPDSASMKKFEDRLEFTRSVSMGRWATGKHFSLEQANGALNGEDLLDALKKFDLELSEIAAGSRKPYARFPMEYDRNGPGLSLRPLVVLARLYSLRALGELAHGRTDPAMADIETILRLARSTENSPLLVSQLMQQTILAFGFQPLWEGLSAHQWPESQLAALQGDFQKADLLASIRRSFVGERAFGVSQMMFSHPEFFQKPWTFRGWFYQNVISSNRYYDEHIFQAIDPAERRVYPRKLKVPGLKLLESRRFFLNYNTMVALIEPPVEAVMMRGASVQAALDQASVACALERYRLIYREYPEKLEMLVPAYFSKLPHDLMDGQPLRYKRTGDGKFILYSVGWNETDDHGTVVFEESGRNDIKQGDWVWRYP